MSGGGVNKVILIGRLGADPEVRYMPNGNALATVNIATSESWKDKNTGETRERTEWHRVVFFRGLAEVVGQYLRKGSQVYVEGRLQTRKWQGQDGQDRYTTEVIVDVGGTMQMLDSRGASGGTVPLGGAPSSAPQSGGGSVGGAQPGGTPVGGGQPQPSGDQPQPGGGTGPVGGAAPPPQHTDDFDDDVPF